MNVKFQFSYDIKITLKSNFWRENVEIMPYIYAMFYGPRFIMLPKFVNH